MIDKTELAYIAGILDALAVIRIRQVGGTELPFIAMSGSNVAMLEYLAKITGTRSITTRRTYYKAGCSEHCKDKHQHVVSVSGRWSLTGYKTTVVLWNVWSYMRFQRESASEVLHAGLTAPYKPKTLRKMEELGWAIPNTKEA